MRRYIDHDGFGNSRGVMSVAEHCIAASPAKFTELDADGLLHRFVGLSFLPGSAPKVLTVQAAHS
jgi:hypothetical protein